MVRLIRSKGVGVYFVTQNPLDVPETVLGQLGNRVQHALRAFTPRDQKAVKTAADTITTTNHRSRIGLRKAAGRGNAARRRGNRADVGAGSTGVSPASAGTTRRQPAQQPQRIPSAPPAPRRAAAGRLAEQAVTSTVRAIGSSGAKSSVAYSGSILGSGGERR